MSEENIRKILRSYRAAPPAGTWERIAAGLDQAEALKKAARPVSYARPAGLLLLAGLLVWPLWLQQEEAAGPSGYGSETVSVVELLPLSTEVPAPRPEVAVPVQEQMVSITLPTPILAAPAPDRSVRPATVEPVALPVIPADAPVAQPDLMVTEQESPLPPALLTAPAEEVAPRQRSVTVVINLKKQTQVVPDSTFQSAPQKKPASVGSLLRELKRIKFED